VSSDQGIRISDSLTKEGGHVNPSLPSIAGVNRLKRLPLFASCSSKQLRRIEPLMTETRVNAGRVLISHTVPHAGFFVVIGGTATIRREGVQLETVGPGGFFGEQSLLVPGARTATVIADTAMELFVLSEQEFRSPDFLIPPVMERMLEALSERLRRADERWSGAPAHARSSSDVLLKGWAPVPSLP
jgi:CRP/FNR family transcriptional regulator, cyclic AMP receptor protein